MICIDRGREAPADAKGWKAYLVDSDEDPEQDELAYYCPACAEREFAE